MTQPTKYDLASLNIANVLYLEQLHNAYRQDPQQVASSWRTFFEDLSRQENQAIPHQVEGGSSRISHRRGENGDRPPTSRSSWSQERRPHEVTDRRDENTLDAAMQERVDLLIRNYRMRGHKIARFNPLLDQPEEHPELEPEFYGFTSSDLGRICSTSAVEGGDRQTLHQLIQRMHDTYCDEIGVQYMHIDSLSVRHWLEQRMERSRNRIAISRDMQLRILTRLTDAVMFEEFIRKKYVGAKSFSLEGGESLLPLLDLAIEHSADQEVEEIVIGMAHRGRLNVLANIVGKSPRQIFREFEDVDAHRHQLRGDVKYHLGYSCDWKTQSGRQVHVSLCFNPSHLEFVGPVAMGRLRAKQDRAGDLQRKGGMVVLIHGDAAFSGEGVVQESLNLSQLPAYEVGGALHVIVNNQIGFTTPPSENRSTNYATDVAKMLQSPIFHVNGESPRAVAQVVQLALDFRQMFQRDVVIDMYCYRRLGHNEGDEPRFTQPQLYRLIDQRPSVRDAFLDHLLQLKEVTREEADKISEQRREHLEEALAEAREEIFRLQFDTLGGVWKGYHGGKEEPDDDVDTSVKKTKLTTILKQLTQLPESFQVHRKLARLIDARREMAAKKSPLDWSAAEVLAFGTLALEGHRIRLTGQDSARGTFSHRHAVLHDVDNGDTWFPLAHLSSEQAPVEIYNSALSEAGVLGFEYGYSLDCPEGLILWEAQFGDFANAAQVIIDQFIAAAEEKWLRLSGLVLLLPHGFEGQGPEHSSARIERFLMLAADDNLQVATPTTPAQYFHLLRRQVLRRWRKPLVVITPKSLLRHPQSVSDLSCCAKGGFERVLSDPDVDPDNVKQILLCSGKIYYQLLARREQLQRSDVAIIRLEQIYPLPMQALASTLQPFADETPVCWVQEEPANMGPWPFLRLQWGQRLLDRFPLEGLFRPPAASPATGSLSGHRREQEGLLKRAIRER